MKMTLGGLKRLTGGLNAEATLTVSIHGVLYDVSAAIGCEMHDDPDSPYVVLGLEPGGHRYGRQGERRG